MSDVSTSIQALELDSKNGNSSHTEHAGHRQSGEESLEEPSLSPAGYGTFRQGSGEDIAPAAQFGDDLSKGSEQPTLFPGPIRDHGPEIGPNDVD